VPLVHGGDVSIEGTDVCPTRTINATIYPEVVKQLDVPLKHGKTAKPRYDSNANVYQVAVQQSN
jgi:hypothetical protein